MSSHIPTTSIARNPISSLCRTRYLTSCIIVRVTYKTQIVVYDNGNQRGKVFLMYLLDGSSEIVATVFDNLCDPFFNRIQEGEMYVLSGFEVMTSSQEYNLVDNELEINFTYTTTLHTSSNDQTIPPIRYNLEPLSSICNKPDLAPVDTIGVCAEVGEVDNRGGYKIREVILREYGTKVMLNLWNDEAENFRGQLNDIILVKGTRVRWYDGTKRLNFDYFSYMEINPDIPEARSLMAQQ
ncbi:hypothetical protein KR009_008516 [Drosophila setifemur]|nr:hypothetical protein KR009_008516 [Drosophila setifemur]